MGLGTRTEQAKFSKLRDLLSGLAWGSNSRVGWVPRGGGRLSIDLPRSDPPSPRPVLPSPTLIGAPRSPT